MRRIPTYRDYAVSGLSFEDIVAQAKATAEEAQYSIAKQANESVATVVKDAAEAHAEKLVESGSEKVGDTWAKAKPWVIGGAVVATVGVIALVARRR